jgi:hypothetical protein
MQPENVKSFAIAIATALGFLLATVPVASAQNTTQCTGTLSDGSTINGNLVVPPNASCTLTNVTVIGNVQVGVGAALSVFPGPMQAVTIDGNITADQCNVVEIDNNSGLGVTSVEGNMNIQNCKNGSGSGYQGPNVTISGNFVCANTPFCGASSGVVQGNLTVDNNLLGEVSGNQVSGNVDVSGNSPFGITVAGNTIGGNLRCSNNKPAPVDDNNPNTVSGHKLDQCAGL